MAGGSGPRPSRRRRHRGGRSATRADARSGRAGRLPPRRAPRVSDRATCAGFPSTPSATGAAPPRVRPRPLRRPARPGRARVPRVGTPRQSPAARAIGARRRRWWWPDRARRPPSRRPGARPRDDRYDGTRRRHRSDVPPELRPPPRPCTRVQTVRGRRVPCRRRAARAHTRRRRARGASSPLRAVPSRRSTESSRRSTESSEPVWENQPGKCPQCIEHMFDCQGPRELGNAARCAGPRLVDQDANAKVRVEARTAHLAADRERAFSA